ncbi:MAG: S8 family serine peptidase, partial [Candidatus Eisenbacteria bacterium]
MHRWLLRSLVVSFLLLAVSVAWSDSSKLDPRIRRVVHDLQSGVTAEALRGGVAPLSAAGDLDVFIQGDHVSRAALEAAGAVVRTEAAGVFTATVPVDAIDAVAAVAGVLRVTGASPVDLNLDASVPTTGVNVLRGAGPGFAGLNGAGVIVGDVDTGVDYHHGDFKDALGNTRVLNIWDQTDAGGPNPSSFAYGSEWNSTDINTLAARQKDTNGHGTHCMGIAAGDGSQTGGAVPAFTYVGMAPMADIVEVKTDLTDTHIVDGVNYVFQRATALGKNAVCNLSLGSQFGPHDGTSAFESAISGMTGAGRIVCVSAGNDGGNAIHAQILAAPAGTNITLNVTGSGTNRIFACDGYYEGTEAMNVTVKTPNGTVIGPITLGTNDGASGMTTANGLVYVENGIFATAGGAYEVYFECDIASGQNANGLWTFTFNRIGGPGPANGRFDFWRFFVSSGLAANFVAGLDNGEMQVSEPGCAKDVLTVAAWATKVNWTDCGGRLVGFVGAPSIGSIATFSSPGLTRDGRLKPDVAAPGTPIGSTRSTDIAAACPGSASLLLPDGLNHTINQGTSMAAPHLTGMVALLMQQYGALVTPAFVRNWLQVHSLQDLNTGATWNNRWGWGKLYYGTDSDPVTQVVSPNGGEVTVIASVQPLTWNATDPDGVASVDLKLSRDGGYNYTTIATGIPNTGSYNWNVTGPTTNNAILSVVAHDTGGHLGTDISDQVWAIIDQPVATLLSLFVAEPVQDGIQLRWGFSNPAQFRTVQLQRARSEAGPFADVTAEIRRDAEFTVALDRDVVSG